MKYQIKSRYDDRVLYELECESIKECVESAVKGGANLGGANLYGADLGGAYLGGAYLRGADLSGADLGEKFGKLLDKGYFSAGPLGSREDYLQAFHTEKGIFIKAGCFFDSLEAFRAAVTEKHGETSKHGKPYLGMANVIEFKFAGEEA